MHIPNTVVQCVLWRAVEPVIKCRVCAQCVTHLTYYHLTTLVSKQVNALKAMRLVLTDA